MERKPNIDSAAVVGVYKGLTAAEVAKLEHLPGRFSQRVFKLPDGFYCCPVVRRKPPRGFKWVEVVNLALAERFPTRPVYVCKINKEI
jgi:hypothetical protein